MLPSGPQVGEDGDEEDGDEDALRESYLLAIRLIWVQAQTKAESMEQELELLRNVPPLPPSQRSEKLDDMWRLDPSIRKEGLDGRGPLMDSSGRVCSNLQIIA